MLSLTNIRRNWQAGLTVALVSIPLSISLAIASHATPLMGVITAVWAGLVGAMLGGTNYNIVGPTGALSGSIAAIAIMYGVSALPTLAILTGIFIAIAFYLQMDRLIVYVPHGVMHGFTLAVGIIIGLGQLNFALGVQVPPQKYFFDSLLATIARIADVYLPAFFTFLLFFALILFLWRRLPQLPPLVVITPIGILFGLMIHGMNPYMLETIGTKFGSSTAALLSFSTLTFDFHMLVPALGIAFIAILETLISAKLADHLTHTTHDAHKELIGLSLANIAAGVFGGFPATAALARTSLNIKSGATNRMAGIESSLCIAVISLLFLPWFSYLPLPVVAAMLLFLSIRMIEHEHFVHMWHTDRSECLLALFVAVVCIVEEPVTGILLGSLVAWAMKRPTH